MTPWKTTSPINTPVWILERNPYYFGSTPDGNQLPYIDKIQMTLAENLEVLNLRAIAGEYDIQERHDIAKLPVFLENAAEGQLHVRLDPADYGAEVQLYVNQSYDADPEIAKWITNRDFRRALSMGIDRDQLNESFWLGHRHARLAGRRRDAPALPGAGVADQVVDARREAGERAAGQDRADKKDAEGYRVRTDNGQRLRLEMTTIQAAWMDQTAVCEMIAQHWKQIGIQADSERARAEPDGAADRRTTS